MLGFIARFLINALGLYVASVIVPGIHIFGADAIIFAALIFGVVNALVRPIAMLFGCLINLLTLGLFTLVINAAMLYLASWIAQQLGLYFWIDDFLSAFFGALIISIISFVLTNALR